MFLSIKWVNHLIKATGANGKHLVGRITDSPKTLKPLTIPSWNRLFHGHLQLPRSTHYLLLK
jgi:hypothetical protein